MEIWKDIKGYEGKYQCSNLGNIKSLVYKKPKILKPRLDKDGYLKVILYKDGPKEFRVHRLIADTFISHSNDLCIVNHKDENKSNNCVDNLEWCNANYNNNYGMRNSKIRKKNTNHESKSIKVEQYSKEGDLIKVWPSLREVERELGLPHNNIMASIKRNGYCGNFKWKILTI